MRDHVSADPDEGEQTAVDHLDSDAAGPAVVVTPSGVGGFDPMIQGYTQEVLFGERGPAEAAQAFIDELQGGIDAAQQTTFRSGGRAANRTLTCYR